MITTINHANGHTSTYDDAIIVGSVITAYHTGYWRVTKVTERPGNTPHFKYVQLAKADGTLVNGKTEKGCDAAYCTLMTREYISTQHDQQLKAADDLYDALMGLLQ